MASNNMTAQKNVLLVYYSQTGQLEKMADYLVQPLKNNSQINLEIYCIKPEIPYRFPWQFMTFFNTFPETVHLQPASIESPVFKREKYDLVILAYSVWFLSPSQPVAAFLCHPKGRAILADTPVVTCIGCRNMWLMAQERVKELLLKANARLVDNIVKTDSCSGPASFIATPLWMLTGKKQPIRWLPKAGISEVDMATCERFGERIQQVLLEKPVIDQPMLKNMGAVHVNERLILSEKFAYRSFYLWGKLLMAVGKKSPALRRAILCFYIVFLVAIILTVVPITAVIKQILSPWLKTKIQAQKAYFGAPSGE